MQDRPTSRELIDAVAQFLTTELAPTLADPRQKFRTLVAANVLTIVSRELESQDSHLSAEYERLTSLLPPAEIQLLDFSRGVAGEESIQQLTRALAQKIRSGQADDGEFHDAVFARVEQTVIEKLQIANPKYLERVQNEP